MIEDDEGSGVEEVERDDELLEDAVGSRDKEVCVDFITDVSIEVDEAPIV